MGQDRILRFVERLEMNPATGPAGRRVLPKYPCTHHTWQALVGIMGWPVLQPKARPNSGMF
jgi:hypothetical protein